MEETVAVLQQLLIRLGYAHPDLLPNVLDELTLDALKTFQRLHNLAQTGEPDRPTWDALRAADERGESIIFGQVVAGALPVARAVVSVRDRDLGAPDTWPRLGDAPTGPDGRFVIAYTMDPVLGGDRQVERRIAVPELVFDVPEAPFRFRGFDVYRLPQDALIGDEDRALGLPARRVESVRIELVGARRRWTEGASEYERVLAAFRAVWPEVSPGSLDTARAEPAFAARELDLPREQVDALAFAFRASRTPFDGTVPEPILYALARSSLNLVDVAALALASSSDLKPAILDAIERLVIPPQDDEAIERSIEAIRRLAPRSVLGEAGFAGVLQDALPDRAQQAALLSAAGRRDDDAPSMWDALRANPAFAAPGVIERAQFALQLDALTARHVPLMSALQQERGVASTRDLLDLGADALKAIVRRENVGVPAFVTGDSDEARADAYVSGVMAQLHMAFPTETVGKLIAAASPDALGGERLRGAAAEAIARATTRELRDAGRAFDIRTSNIDAYAAERPEILSGIDEADRPAALGVLKRSQRLHSVSSGPEAFQWLLGTRYGSAHDIAQVPLQTFMAGAAPALGEAQARIMHNRATAIGAVTLMSYVGLRDALTGPYPAALDNGRDWIDTRHAVKDALLKRMPSWGELFGETSFCECAHCRSVYSPAAYFVDVLNMLDYSVPNAAGVKPLDVLFARRPDLARIALTCENTNTAMPYVDLVNEALEALVVWRDAAKLPAFDTGLATAQELQAAPQHTDWSAYLTPAAAGSEPRLDRAVHPLALPFDAFLARGRAFLEPLQATRAELMRIFGGPTMTSARAAELLGVSPAMFEAITGETIDGAASTLAAGIDDRYGFALGAPAAGAPSPSTLLAHLPTLLARTGLSYADLEAWLRTRTVNPERATLDTLGALGLPADDVLAFAEAGFVDPTAALDAALATAGVAQADFATWATACLDAAALARLRGTIVTDAAADAPCDLDAVRVVHWDPASPAIADSEWLSLEKLIRLQRAIGWEIDELDLALGALGVAAPTAKAVRQLAQIAQMARSLDLSIAQVVALFADLNPARPAGLYARHFRSRATLRLDPAFDVDWSGRTLAGADVADHLPALRATLRLSAADLDALRAAPGIADGAEPSDDALDVPRLSQLFRHALLARALGVSVRDLITLLAATGMSPFVPPDDEWPLAGFVDAARAVLATNLNAAQLTAVLSAASAARPDEARDKLLAELRDGLRAITADFDVSRERADGELTRRALALLGVDAKTIDEALQALLATARPVAALAAPAAPAPVVPPAWAERIAYGGGASAPSLALQGTLTGAEEGLVRGFSADAAWQQAVHAVWAAPRAALDRLAAALAARGVTIADPTAALDQSAFVAGTDARDAAIVSRLHRVLDSVIPTVIARAKRMLALQALSATGIDAATLGYLLDGTTAAGKPVLPATDTAKPMLADFLSLETAAVTDAAVIAYELLAKLKALVSGLALDVRDVRALAGSLLTLRSSPLRLIDFDEWSTMAGYVALRDAPGTQRGGFAVLFAAATNASMRDALAGAFGWRTEVIDGLMQPSALGYTAADLHNVNNLARFADAARLLDRMRVGAVDAASWARQPITQPSADAIERAARTGFDEPGWLEVARAANDTLRAARRDALVAYLLPRLGVRDADALYESLLIDVQTMPVVKSSRIKQAISTVQLFVQRCLLNVEKDVAASAIDARHWAWMQNYRVWEANRKVLLYPENWIEPGLRDDKTPFFRELESDLLQDDVTDESVERALLAYLDKLDGVAKLEIMAMTVQDDFEPGEALETVVHLFGRSANAPHAYYYRTYAVTRNVTTHWTPWEKVPVDVQGTLVACAVHHRRLYLFWAVISTKPKPSPGGGTKPQPPEFVQEIILCWSEYRNGAWSPKRTTAPQELLVAEAPDDGPTDTNVQGFVRPPPRDAVERVEAIVEGDTLRVVCIASRSIIWTDDEKKLSYTSPLVIDGQGNVRIADGNQGYTYGLGSFVLDTCHGRMVADSTIYQAWLTRGFVLRRKDGALQAKPLASKPVPAAPVLGSITDSSALAEERWIHEGSGYAVFADADRTYFGRVSRVRRMGHELLEIPHHAELRDVGKAVLQSPSSFSSKAIKAALTDVQVKATGSANPWASAQVSLATVALRGDDAVVAASPAFVGSIAKAKATFEIGQYLVTPPDVATIAFESLFHPFVCEYVRRVAQYGVDGLLTLDSQRLQLMPEFAGRYAPTSAVVKPYPADGVDFGATQNPAVFRTTSYSVYNWELFFHIPMLVASRLTLNQRFAEARRWLHFVFNPTDGKGSYWKVEPLAKTPVQSIDAWFARLGAGDADVQAQIAEWKDHPFEPHRIARMRLPSYQKYVVMQYLDNLIAWGDHLFARETLESINHATLLYVMAGNLLGKRLVAMPQRGEPPPMTFAQMRGKLDALSNVAIEFENAFPHLASSTLAPSSQTAGLLGLGKSLYFCVPPNDKLLGYWDTVGDRLFKIRNSLSLSGVFRELPLFEPPIDPALLVRATAAGVDIGSVLAETTAPAPLYRFSHALHDAIEACADVRALGSAMLAALEKKEAEEIALLRASHETALQKASIDAAKQREAEADAQVQALERSRNTPIAKLLHFRGLMGVDDLSIPEIGADIPNVAYNPKPAAEGGVFLIQEEREAMAASHSGRDWQVRSAVTESLASLMHYIPDVSILTAPWGAGSALEIGIGGKHVGPALTAISKYQASLGAQDSYDAAHATKMGEYKRRQQSYAHEANLAGREVMHVDRLILAAKIRVEIARLEREQIELRIEQALTVEEHLRARYASRDLYAWMQSQLAGVYFQAYQLAYDRAKGAERAFRFERGITSSGYVRFGAWDSLRKGLLAGEQLQLDLRRLERAYHDQNRRDLELTRHFSLLQIAPLALLRLKEAGTCEVELPEWLYDLDYPGHYMRRLKSVSLSVPAVVGPYSTINATLTMLSNETRVRSTLRNGRYERDLDSEDDRFVDDFTTVQAIATSSGRDDAGMFELSLRDERYLPFEGGGAASRWRIRLDPDCNRFDVDSIADIVLHVKYTARDGGAQLADKAKERWKKLVADQQGAPLVRMLSLRNEFPTEWQRLRASADAAGDHAQAFAITRDRFPMLFQQASLTVTRIDLIGVPRPGANPTKAPAIALPAGAGAAVLEVAAPLAGLLHLSAPVTVAVKDTQHAASWTLSVRKADVAASLDQLDDVLLVFQYTAKPAAA